MHEEVSPVTVADPEEAAESGGDEMVRYQVADTGVALLTLNRPERMNAWGGGLAGAF